MSAIQILLTILIITAGTMLTRFLPFVLFPSKEKTPSFISFLGEVLPYAVIPMLVVYCLKEVSFANSEQFLPQCIAITGIVCLHMWKKNTLLSIAGGTILYMFLVQLMF